MTAPLWARPWQIQCRGTPLLARAGHILLLLPFAFSSTLRVLSGRQYQAEILESTGRLQRQSYLAFEPPGFTTKWIVSRLRESVRDRVIHSESIVSHCQMTETTAPAAI